MFQDDESLIIAKQWLWHVIQDFYIDGLHALVSRWRTAVESYRDYMEKLYFVVERCVNHM